MQQALSVLLNGLSLDAHDTVISLGDYVDRGPDTHGVLEQLLGLERRCHFLPLSAIMNGCCSACSTAPWTRGCGGTTAVPKHWPATAVGWPRSPTDTWSSSASATASSKQTPTSSGAHQLYDANAALDEQPERFLLWTHIFDGSSRTARVGKDGVLGHTPQLDGRVLDVGHLVCIDTCCFANGWLTALDVVSGTFWQANEEGAMRTGVLR